MRVIGIWLDGFEKGLADEWELPTLAALERSSACATLDHGSAFLTGLTGEHVASGLDPSAMKRTSAVEFDLSGYTSRMRTFQTPTVFGDRPTVVLDPCYFDLGGARSSVSGVVDWGTHDPGGPRQERPDGLYAEIVKRFGEYPAKQWIYGLPWPSAEHCRQMGDDLAQGVRDRLRIATWMLAERLPDWEVALIGVSEAHGGTEGLFHGADPAHPLADSRSAPEAGRALRRIYTEIDRLVAGLVDAFPDAVHVVFAMHGMGPNSSDVASMALLGELMCRWNGIATPDTAWSHFEGDIPTLGPHEEWGRSVSRALDGRNPARGALALDVARRAKRFGRTHVAARLPHRGLGGATAQQDGDPLRWMPLTRHEHRWPNMRAFAIPSFYDGRIRLNVAGREANGLVAPGEYRSVLDEIEQLLGECRDGITDAPVVAGFERPLDDPMDARRWDADLIVHWAGMPLGFVHPQLGRIGPLPPRRTGGHTNPRGFCIVHGPGIGRVDLGCRSSFDVVPTMLELSGCSAANLSGVPLPITASQ